MKRISILIAAIVGLYACNKYLDNPDPINPIIPDGDWITFSSSANLSPVIAAEGGSVAVSFSAYGNWQLADNQQRVSEWLTVSPSSGNKGDNTITITADTNDTYDERNATVKLICGTETKSIVVTQKQKDAITVSKSKFEVSSFGEDITVEVKANINYFFEIEDNAKSWITEIGTKAMASKSLTFRVAENEGNEKREGTITFSSGNIKEILKIYQEGTTPVIILSQSEYAVAAGEETIQVEVKSNVDVSYSIPSGVDWITEAKTKAMSTSTFYFQIAANETYESRTTEIFFKNDANGLSEKVIITQVPQNAIVVAKNSYNVNNNGGNIEIKVSHNVDFDIDIADSWVSQTTTKSYTTDKLVFTVAENTTTDNRETKITFTSKDKTISQIVKIYQSQTNALVLSEKDKAISADGGSFTIEINHNVEFEVVMPKVNWITAVETKAMSTSTKSFSVARNDSYEARTAEVTFKSKDGNLSDKVIITQMQKGAIIVAKDKYEFDRSGGNLSVEVSHSIEFDIEISEGWITEVTTKTLSTTTKTFSIAKNDSGEEREGAITFKSKDGAVSQRITIKQGIVTTIVTTDKNIILENGGGSVSVGINPDVNFDFDVVYPDNTDYDKLGWISASSIKEPRIHLSINANTSYDMRRALLIVKDIDTEKLDTVKIFVKPQEYLEAETTVYELPYTGGDCIIYFNSSYDYEITIPESASWLKRVETKAIQSHTVTLYAEENKDNSSRETVVKISLQDGTLFKDITIKQYGMVYLGDYTINNHNDVIYLRDNKFKMIDGNLTINSNPSDLDNMIEEVTGNLVINVQCDGLYGLKSVGGDLTLNSTNSEGLNNLQRVEGILRGGSFESMSNLSYVGGLQLSGSPKGLSGLSVINGNLEVVGVVNDFEGLNNLTEIIGNFIVSYYSVYNSATSISIKADLKTFNGLNSLSRIDGDFIIQAYLHHDYSLFISYYGDMNYTDVTVFPYLESFEGLSSLNYIGGDFKIISDIDQIRKSASDNKSSINIMPKLASINIPSLKSIGGVFEASAQRYFKDTGRGDCTISALASLNELKMDNLSVISSGKLKFKTGTQLVRGLPKITSLEKLEINYNFPSEEAGFPSLNYLGCSLEGNGLGFQNLETICGDCSVSNCSNLKRLKLVKGNVTATTSFPSLQTINGDAKLSGDGNSLLTTIGGSLYLDGKDISGLNSLKKVSGNVSIKQCSITGMKSIESISNLTISDCQTLSDVGSFSSLSNCNSITITNCPNLYDFTPFVEAVMNGSSWAVTGCGYNPTKYQMKNGQSKLEEGIYVNNM